MHIDAARPTSATRDQTINLYYRVSVIQRAPDRQRLQVSVPARLIDGSAPPTPATADGHLSLHA
jgi:hypothetical protein